jgi:DNA modification methylase
MSLQIHQGDALTVLRLMDAESVQCCVTSPPYWGLRDYGTTGQLGLEQTPEEYVAAMVEVFREVRRVLRDDGTCWVNLGDTYAHRMPGGGCVFDNGRTDGRMAYESDKARGREKVATLAPGLKSKDLCGIPWRVTFALQADGWWLRSDIIWHKPNPMPESVIDRPTKAHEYIFLLTKAERYFYDAEAIKEPADNEKTMQEIERQKRLRGNGTTRGISTDLMVNQVYKWRSDINKYEANGRNKRSVWTVPTAPYPDAHFATYPPALITPCILAGSRPGDVIFDPFAGSGTTGMVALELGRRAVLIELNPEYVKMIDSRCSVTYGLPLAI